MARLLVLYAVLVAALAHSSLTSADSVPPVNNAYPASEAGTAENIMSAFAAVSTGDVKPTEAFQKALKKYEKTHTKQIKKLMSPEDHRKAKLLVFRICCGELGNRMLAATSSLLLAMLTGRALLLDWKPIKGFSEDDFGSFFVPPVPKSHWELQETLAMVGGGGAVAEAYARDFWKTMRDDDQGVKCEDHMDGFAKGTLGCYMDISNRHPKPYTPLICDDVVKTFSKLPVLVIQSNQVFSSFLANNPHHAKKIAEWFPGVAGGQKVYPNGMFASLASWLFHPRPVLLERLRAVQDRMRGFTVGIQLRRQMRKGKDKEGAGTSKAHEQMYFDCAEALITQANAGSNFTVFLATDHAPSRKSAKKRFGDKVVFQSGAIASDREGMLMAVTDVWMLGMTDEIITTSGSTFGYASHARTGKVPNIVTLATPPSCVRIRTSEPCVHTWPFTVEQKCNPGHIQASMAAYAAPHCNPWDMEWFGASASQFGNDFHVRGAEKAIIHNTTATFKPAFA